MQQIRLKSRAHARARQRRARLIRTAMLVVALGVLAVLAFTRQDGAGPARGGQTPSPAPSGGLVVESFGLFSPSAGWALTENDLLLTRDFGESWVSVLPEQVEASQVSSVFFLSEQRGWVTAGTPPDADDEQPPSEVIYRTTNGGLNWRSSVVDLPASESYDADFADWTVADIFFSDQMNGWMTVPRRTDPGRNEGFLYRTTDGGAAWQELPVPLGERVRFDGGRNGVTAGAVGDRIRIFASNDSGSTWFQGQELLGAGQATVPVSAPRVFDASDAIVAASLTVAGSDEPLIYFYETEDGGQNWLPGRAFPFRASLEAISFIDRANWKAVVGAEFYATSDSGESWTETTTSQQLSILKMQFATPEAGWALAGEGECSRWTSRCEGARLYSTSDGGETFARLDPEA